MATLPICLYIVCLKLNSTHVVAAVRTSMKSVLRDQTNSLLYKVSAQI